ncbi:MAG TPA: methyltransferase [Gammaproteobacteria bacterium]|nr:MAG: hypothetical protein A3E83_06800 [Gammaproteobacteria bacterium RIFCSPHIGHO2_12_FULL_41_20]HLB43531.1 methyltransferase [Gammaproteobacteria bacterium]
MALPKYVQYGCGLDAPSGWLNFDASPTLFLQKIPIVGFIFHKLSVTKFPLHIKYGNIIRGLPIEKESCQAIYCSHILEHLSQEDFRIAIQNTFSYLVKGGIFRFVVPDLECLAQIYLASSDPNACSLFMQNCCLGKKNRNKNFFMFLREWLGHSQHLWMWDFKGLTEELKSVGFQQISRAEYGDSQHIKFREVEELNRWEKSVGIECIKP